MTPTTSPAWASELMDLLDQQRCLYYQLHRLSQQQSQLIAETEPDMSGLVMLLGQRQNLIDQLAQLSSCVDPFRRNWPSLWEALDAHSRQRVRGLIDDIQALLDEIVGRDEKARAELSGRRRGEPESNTPTPVASHSPRNKARFYDPHN